MMLNQVMLVGKINKYDAIDQSSINLSVAVQRFTTSGSKEIVVDIIPCLLTGNLSTTFTEYCQIGNTVGVRGKLQVENQVLYLLVDKITFLSSKKLMVSNNEVSLQYRWS